MPWYSHKSPQISLLVFLFVPLFTVSSNALLPSSRTLFHSTSFATRSLLQQNSSIDGTPTSGSTEASALLAFKAGITTDLSNALKSWNLTLNPDPCKWGKTVACNANNSVSQLKLRDLALEGTIAEEIGQLTNLTVLDLAYNALSGNLPASLCKLSLLEELYLDDNSLTRGLPECIGSLGRLQVLSAPGNNFSGSVLPDGIANLSRLNSLNLNGTLIGGPIPPGLATLPLLDNLNLIANRFNGSIPEEFSRYNGTYLYLGRNRLAGGIPFLGGMESIAVLDLSYNPLTGTIPPSLTLLNGTLRNLDLSYCNLTGSIPAAFGDLFNPPPANETEQYYIDYIPYYVPYPNSLYLTGNALTGNIPRALGRLQQIEVLDLSDNALTGSIPLSFRNLTTIVNLVLSNNQLSGTVPEIFGTLKGLQGLYLDRNFLSGPIPVSLGRKANCQLRQVILSDNLFTGSIPPNVATCPDLVQLSLSTNRLAGSIPRIRNSLVAILLLNQNRFTGQIPASLGTLPYLERLDLSDNLLHGTVPVSLFKLPNLTDIDVSRNKLNVTLPNVSLNTTNTAPIVTLDISGNFLPGPLPGALLASLRSTLTFLYAEQNQLNGSLPTRLANLTFLKTLSVPRNRLSGRIPDEIGSMASLVDLDLSNNSLTGGVPPTLANLTDLQTLVLSQNFLNGSLPTGLGSLKQLLLLDLSVNSLTGSIPPDLGSLPLLRTLNLSVNALTGPVPEALASLSSLVAFDVSRNGLSGQLPAGNLTRFNASSFSQNPNLCGGPLPACPEPPVPASPASLSKRAIVGIAVGSSVAFLGFLGLFLGCFLVWGRRGYEEEEGEFLLFQKLGAPLNFRIILEATEGFSPKKVLGEGGFGSVYRVTLKDGTELAVKRLHQTQGNEQGMMEVKTEMQTLGKVKHRNLVLLVGGFIGKKECLLIYEFLPGGDLEGSLFEEKRAKGFSEWAVRLNCLLDSARGLKYLHHDAPLAIIHRDIKPPNILFDADMNAKVADFGLAKEIDVAEKTHLSTSVSGTVGYLAPEYATSGRLTMKSDVFAYGIVVLQVLTGKRPGEDSLGDFGLAKWVHKMWKEKGLAAVLDPRMVYDEESEEQQVIGALRLALMCSSKVQSNRPTMDEVVYLLENLDIFDDQSGHSLVSDYTTTTGSASAGGVGGSANRSSMASFSGADGSLGDPNSFRSSDMSYIMSSNGDSVASIGPVQRSQGAI